MTNRIWCLGDAVVDLLPGNEQQLLQCPGGAPANVAVGIARLHGISGFIGRVGGDPFGGFLKQTLQGENVDVSHMRTDDNQRTSTVLVSLDDKGERTFTFMVRPSADLFLEAEDLPSFMSAEWLHCCSNALIKEPSRTTTLTAMQQMRAAGGFVSFDPNIRLDLWPVEAELRRNIEHALQLANVVKLSEEELTFIAGNEDAEIAIGQLALRFDITLLLVTQGAAGVRSWHEGTLKHFPARLVDSVDTTGAGDAFVAGLLWGFAKFGMPADEKQLASRLECAQACGALATTAKGAMTAMPDAQQLRNYLDK